MAEGLTKKQRAVLNFIRSEVRDTGSPPTIREIGERFGLRSTGSVRDHLRALENKGHIGRLEHRSRGIVLRNAPQSSRSAPTPARPTIPLLGDIAAGAPTLAVENIEEQLELDPALFGGGELFALRVRGDSMIEAGIHEGDRVIVRRQAHADNGDIVVALIDDEATVKRFFHETHRVRLQPENATLDPIYLEPGAVDLCLLGKVVGVIRHL